MAKKEIISTGVAVAGQFTQQDIPSLLEKVNAQISALKGDKESNSRITGELGNGFGKVASITDVNQLREAYAYVTHKEEAVKKFDEIFKAATPGIKLPVLKEGGSTATQWQNEIILQYKEISYKEQISKLEAVKQKLTDNLSAELKLAATLNDIADMLKIE